MEALPDQASLKGDFVEAIDGQSSTIDVRLGVSQAIGACWMSHQKALVKFLASGKDFALVFEDDAVVRASRGSLSTRARLERLIPVMKKRGISVLQVGHLRRFWPLEELRYIRNKQNVKMAGEKIVLADFVAGAHSYIISKEFAKEILGLNIPVVFGPDDYFGVLAKKYAAVGGSSWDIARLRQPIFAQESRQKSSSRLDSDINT
jgi:GR25 family glycosyltransferase involved in LPS biosynthesis